MAHEERESTSMIDVCVGKHDPIDLVDFEWKSNVLCVTLAALSLEETAVENDGLSCNTENVAGSGYLTCGTTELYFHENARGRWPLEDWR